MRKQKKPLQAVGAKSKGSLSTGQYIDKYSYLRNKNNEFCRYARTREDELNKKQKAMLSRAEYCSRWLQFRDYYTVDKKKLTGANFCKAHIICPMCARRRAVVSVAKGMPKIERVIAETGLKPFLITYTVLNGDDLEERLEHLKTSFSRVIERRRNAKKGICNSAMLGVEGMIYTYEVKRGKNSGQWHPHIHAIALMRESENIGYVKETLRHEWKMITKDSHDVDVERMRDGEHLLKSLCEVFKYMLKFSDLEHVDWFDAWLVMQGKRLSGTVGNLRGVSIESAGVDDVTDFEGLPYFEYTMRYYEKQGYGVARCVDEKGVVMYENEEMDNYKHDGIVTCATMQNLKKIYSRKNLAKNVKMD